MQATPTHEAVDPESGYMSTVTPIMGWLYDEGDEGYTNINAAENRIYQLLAFKQIAGAFQMLWGNTLWNKRESLLNDAAYNQFNLKVYAYRTSSQ